MNSEIHVQTGSPIHFSNTDTERKCYHWKAKLVFALGLSHNMKSNTFVFKLSENLYKLSFPQALHCHSSLHQRLFSLILSLHSLPPGISKCQESLEI